MASSSTCEGGNMNKGHLVEKIAEDANVSKALATTMVESLIESVSGALKKGERVTLSGFGTFSTYQRKARNGRNPQTGSIIKIASRRVAKFTPGVDLKKAVNKK
jgi:DNA-binding protein HU-beta